MPFLWVGQAAGVRDARASGSLLLFLAGSRSLLPIVLIQAGVAVAVAVSARRMRALQGLLAAVVTGLVQVVANLLSGAFYQCWTGPLPGRSCVSAPGLDTVYGVAVQILLFGPLVALAAAIGAAWLARVVRRSGAGAGSARRLRLAVAAGLVVVALVFSGLWVGARGRRPPWPGATPAWSGCG